MKVLDLFSGAGGMSLGFDLAGFEVVAAIDNWSDALATLGKNLPKSTTILANLGDPAEASKAFSQIEAVDVIIGGPPCQGFSIAGKRNPSDPRNLLYQGFLQAVEYFRPRAFVMENVPTIAAPSHRELYEEIISDFQSRGYKVRSQILLASQYGVPQNRRRMFIVGLLAGDNDFRFPEKESSVVSAKEAISDLAENSLPDGSQYLVQSKSKYQTWARRGSRGVFNHEITQHTAKTIEIISQVPDGGNYKSLPPQLQNIRNVNIAWTRLSSSKPSFTIDTGHRHHFHYRWNRVPTARESARLQSFPDYFVFGGSKTSQLRQIGNAVPPLLAKSIATALLTALKGEND